MLAAVSTPLLNVHSIPGTGSAIIGQLTEGMVIVGSIVNEGWVQFSFANSFGWLANPLAKEAWYLTSDKSGGICRRTFSRKNPTVSSSKAC